MRAGTVIVGLLAAILLAACQPSDRTPGMWLRGEAAALPDDFSAVAAVPEIAIEVQAPWGLPHSVTIWSAVVDGTLYVAAGRAATKRWPGWVDERPEVRLKVEGKVFDARLQPLTDAGSIAALQAAYAAKYRLGGSAAGDASGTRYWRVTAR